MPMATAIRNWRWSSQPYFCTSPCSRNGTITKPLPNQTPSNQDDTPLSLKETLKRHQQSTLARIHLGRNNPDLQPWLLRLPPYPIPRPNQDPREDQPQPLQQLTPMQSRKYKTPSTQPSAELEEAEVEAILEEGEEEAVLDLPPEALEELNKFLQDRLRFRRQQTSELWAPHPDSSREKETSPKTGSTNFDTITEPMREYQASSHLSVKLPWHSRLWTDQTWPNGPDQSERSSTLSTLRPKTTPQSGPPSATSS